MCGWSVSVRTTLMDNVLLDNATLNLEVRNIVYAYERMGIRTPTAMSISLPFMCDVPIPTSLRKLESVFDRRSRDESDVLRIRSFSHPKRLQLLAELVGV